MLGDYVNCVTLWRERYQMYLESNKTKHSLIQSTNNTRRTESPPLNQYISQFPKILRLILYIMTYYDVQFYHYIISCRLLIQLCYCSIDQIMQWDNTLVVWSKIISGWKTKAESLLAKHRIIRRVTGGRTAVSSGLWLGPTAH